MQMRVGNALPENAVFHQKRRANAFLIFLKIKLFKFSNSGRKSSAISAQQDKMFLGISITCPGAAKPMPIPAEKFSVSKIISPLFNSGSQKRNFHFIYPPEYLAGNQTIVTR